MQYFFAFYGVICPKKMVLGESLPVLAERVY